MTGTPANVQTRHLGIIAEEHLKTAKGRLTGINLAIGEQD